ncbi:MAG: heavy metal translocating P-type ATPase metal-binding domain-containing protein [Bacteroidota bacterium]|nr:heavy metal translocating P-type ATPase metal-binding domain-containing protein [Bacteroidota bacterium]MDP4232431.1 heavy metal translocating P-type ATPase metal-binding domain-containing protein [Bacteroidota bacterium]MDP4241567.1 heavy metal translocating P-type ATPase metal-binding domain-containing protein [Bacteroidota bacterium]MDP4286311.1 heavy metal translocating P-type ATPase metal-binding domain-containing protein [Bacteroidota bacterium]
MSESQRNASDLRHLAPGTVACVHCGEDVVGAGIVDGSLAFCCSGCKTVYEILAEHELCDYYGRGENAGISMKRRSIREDEFAVLDDPSVGGGLLTFASSSMARVVWTVPAIHCVSCVWLIERFDRLESGVLASTVDFIRRTVTIDFDPRITSLRKIAERMASVGYAPLLRLEGNIKPDHTATRRLYARIGIAGFAAGNTMMMYVAQYFAGSSGVEHPLMSVFRILSIALSVPVLFYCASPWFEGARGALRGRRINLDVPVALGILVLFARSVFDITTGQGEGYLDSFNGLVFFLLIGRLFQQKAFDALSFDRTYRSFFPLSVRIERSGASSVLPIEKVQIGDVLSIRNGEVVPCDSMLESEIGYIDYSFVTGEAVPVECTKGALVYAGGKVLGQSMRLLAIKSVSHSELAAMWDRSGNIRQIAGSNGESGGEGVGLPRSTFFKLSDRFGQWFTGIAVMIALAGASLWLPDWAKAFNILTAVLIIACPCALTLAAPITLGSAMGRLGRQGIYLKNMGVLLDLDRVKHVIFDKTGTLTASDHELVFLGRSLTREEWRAIGTIAAQSTHPISRAIADQLNGAKGIEEQVELDEQGFRLGPVREIIGRGIFGTAIGHTIVIGSPSFIEEECGAIPEQSGAKEIAAAVALDGAYAGAFTLKPVLKSGIANMIARLRERLPDTDKQSPRVALISGDSERDRPLLESHFDASAMTFNCRPAQKVERVQAARAEGRAVLMVGDGLNDAGAMAAADVAIAVTEGTATLVPACDIIMHADALQALPALLQYARAMKWVIAVSLIFSVLYNALGLTLAIFGRLSPMMAAILMPVSSLTVIAISVGGARHFIGSIK